MKIVTASAHNDAYTRHGEGDTIELSDGRLLVVYMEFRGDGSDIAPTRICARESDDHGATWSDAREITATGEGEVNIYSPNLIHANDGSILLLFMRQYSHTPPATTLFVWRSSDDGATFEPHAEFAHDKAYSLCSSVVKRTDNGRLLLPVCTHEALGGNAYAHAYGGAVCYSDDDGRTWRRSESIVRLPMRGVMEPHVEQARDGRVLMVMRSQLGAVFISESTDEGVTWSHPQTTGLRAPESCPCITRMPVTGDLMLIWNNAPYDMHYTSHFGKRSPMTSAISQDDGRMWTYVRNIESDPSRAFTNPGCRFTREGKAVINYWTCEYTPNWAMQNVIDLRIAIADAPWFYGGDKPIGYHG